MRRSVRHAAAAAAIFLFGTVNAHSAPKAPPRPETDLKAIMSRPATFKDQTVVVTGMQCVEDGSYFFCARRVGGAILRLRTLSLGAEAPQRDVEHFVAECVGSINLERPACRFDVQL